MIVPTGNRLPRFALALAITVFAMPALAQETPAPAKPAAPAEEAAPASPEAPAASAEVQPVEVDDETVYATVNGKPITHGDIVVAAQEYASQLSQLPEEARVPELLNVMIDMQLLAEAAEEAGLAETDSVKRQMEFDRARVLRNEYLRDKAPRAVTDEKVRAQFDKELADFVPNDEVHLRHILLASEEEAKAVIAEIEAGGDFAAIATEKSTDKGSGAKGGDLGFIVKGQTVPEFEAAAFGLDVGEVSKEPVESQFGWHVIKVEEKRKEAPPEFAEEENRIRSELTREFVMAELESLREAAKIEIVQQPGAPDAAGEATPTPAPSTPESGATPAQ